MNEIECPYCNANCGIPDENTGEGEHTEWECETCGKSFVYYVEYSADYYSEEAPCLNGGEHKWQSMVGAPEAFFKNKYRCDYCQKEEKRKGV